VEYLYGISREFKYLRRQEYERILIPVLLRACYGLAFDPCLERTRPASSENRELILPVAKTSIYNFSRFWLWDSGNTCIGIITLRTSFLAMASTPCTISISSLVKSVLPLFVIAGVLQVQEKQVSVNGHFNQASPLVFRFKPKRVHVNARRASDSSAYALK
jgi:hypothetical protein